MSIVMTLITQWFILTTFHGVLVWEILMLLADSKPAAVQQLDIDVLLLDVGVLLGAGNI